MKQVTPRPSGFSSAWLTQREPFDAKARETAAPRLALPAQLQRLRQERPRPHEPWRVIDLACGTGANLRWLAPRLSGQQQWLVADHDLKLLRAWPQHLPATTSVAAAPRQQSTRNQPLTQTLQHSGPGFQASIVRQQLDLATNLGALPWAAAHLVTASALLDLASAAWLQQLVQHAAAARVALLLALSVDGRHNWSHPDAEDSTVAALFAAHQRRDKGFAGPALGAAAVPAVVQMLRAAGYRVHTARSDWQLNGNTDAASRALQRALIAGMALAATDQRPTAAAAIQAWQQRRRALAASSTLVVGHMDLLALPPR